eukprot:scaffold1190_cov393-Prasinococcus_capsulatus_cf.AAC.37
MTVYVASSPRRRLIHVRRILLSGVCRDRSSGHLAGPGSSRPKVWQEAIYARTNVVEPGTVLRATTIGEHEVSVSITTTRGGVLAALLIFCSQVADAPLLMIQLAVLHSEAELMYPLRRGPLVAPDYRTRRMGRLVVERKVFVHCDRQSTRIVRRVVGELEPAFWFRTRKEQYSIACNRSYG